MNKYLFISLLFALLPIAGMAQQKQSASLDSIAKSNKEVLKKLGEIDKSIMLANFYLERIDVNNSWNNRYKLYPTENMYTFLEQDTQTGRIQQVQWALSEKNEFSIVINNDDLNEERSTGNYELYPTQNIYQFLLLDKTNGRKWHVQWGLGSSKRWIRRIY